VDDISTVAVAALILVAVCFGLFKCGQWIGEGVVLLRYIEGEQWKEFGRKLTFGAAAAKSLRRNARLRILGPLVVLFILYLFIAVEFGVSGFLISLPSLFIVWMGSKRVDVSKLIMH
jgi:hypothetical protein